MQESRAGERAQPAAGGRALLNPRPAVIIGTLGQGWYAAYTAMPAPGGADPHRRERRGLELVDVVRIAPEVSEAEQGRARAAAAPDPRPRGGPGAGGGGVAQTPTAGAPPGAPWGGAP